MTGMIARVALRPKRGDLLSDRVDLLTMRPPRGFVSEVKCALFMFQAIELLEQALLFYLVGCCHRVLHAGTARNVWQRRPRVTRTKTNLMPDRQVRNC
jgi:hypothetical protein